VRPHLAVGRGHRATDDVRGFAVVDDANSRMVGNLNRGPRVTPKTEVPVHLQQNVDAVRLRELCQCPKAVSDILDAIVARNVAREVVAENANALAVDIRGQFDEALGVVNDTLSLQRIGRLEARARANPGHVEIGVEDPVADLPALALRSLEL